MTQHWNAANDCLEIREMPFYWRLSHSIDGVSGISARLPIRVTADPVYDYLKYEPNDSEWSVISNAYRENENIGFLNPESGQLQSYGSSVNGFFLESVSQFSPERIYEIGCGAGVTIRFLKQHGFNVTGIDPSQYSLLWSQKLDFALINDFFKEDLLDSPADFVFCNDVFEHMRNVEQFSVMVYNCLANEGVFCFATTNSTQSIGMGDISMFEHQHVNMFTEKSIYLILSSAGFSEITIVGGSYGNTFHVTARKLASQKYDGVLDGYSGISCDGYFERAEQRLLKFRAFYQEVEDCHFYVPLRCLPYLATVGDFGSSKIYDSNTAWRGKYIDGYAMPIRAVDDIEIGSGSSFFVGSLTFYDEIKRLLIKKGIAETAIFSINSI